MGRCLCAPPPAFLRHRPLLLLAVVVGGGIGGQNVGGEHVGVEHVGGEQGHRSSDGDGQRK